MQVETTIITTELQTVFGQTFEIKTYEQSITAFCDCCPNQATGVKDNLINQGWYLSQREEFCPECNF